MYVVWNLNLGTAFAKKNNDLRSVRCLFVIIIVFPGAISMIVLSHVIRSFLSRDRVDKHGGLGGSFNAGVVVELCSRKGSRRLV